MNNAIDFMTDLDFDLLRMSDNELHDFAMNASEEADAAWPGSGSVADIERHSAFAERPRTNADRASHGVRHELPTAA